jgi:hypothetical protein
MKKISLLLLLGCLNLNAHTEEYRGFRVVCDKTETIISSLKEKYNEVPLIAGKRTNSVKSTISVWGNPETNTFSVLDTHGDTTCVLAVGTDITILLKEGESI